MIVEEQYRGDWDAKDMWQFISDVKTTVTRAYSMANYPEEYGIIMLNVRIASPPPDRSAPKGSNKYLPVLQESCPHTSSLASLVTR